MAVSTGISFTLSDALQQAEKMDNHFNKWVQQSIEINSNMAKAFDSKGGGNMGHYIQGLKDMKSLIGEIGKGKLSVEVDTSKTEQMANALDRISTYVGLLEKSGVQIFDTQGLYASNKGIIETEDNLASLQEQIESVKEQWHNLLDDSLRGGFEPPINEKTGKAFRKDSKVYKEAFDALEMEIERTREQRKEKQLLLEFELKQLIEREAIAKKELNYAKMTQDEKAKYIQKKLNEILKAEEQQANKIRAEYKTLNQELRNAVNSRSAIEEASKNKSLTEDEEEALIAIEIHEEELRAKIQKMEREHLEYISDLKVSYAIKDAKKIADIIKNRQYSASEALAMASTARTGDEMETAKEAVKGALMTVDKDDVKTIKELNEAYIKLRAGVEALTKAQKNEQTLQPTIRNEYARLLKEIDQIVEAKYRLRSTDAYQDGDGAASKAMSDLEARHKDLSSRAIQLKEQTEGLLDEVERKHASDRARERVAELEKNQKELEERIKKYGAIDITEAKDVIDKSQNVENVRQAQEAIEKLKETRDKLNNSDAKYSETIDELNKKIAEQEDYIESITNAEKHREAQQKKQRETYKGAMDYSKQAKSINDLQKAIKYLEAARNAEDLSTKEGKKRYQELTNELKRQQKAFDGLTGSVKRSGHNLLNIGDQLARKFALVFSVSQIQGYIHSLMQIRGEFELQQRSLQALLQNQDQANEIWQKTVDLAVRSPFRVKELVTYTKQLAAYRVENDKLYETNKMLADVSAGLGVDMNRLILAFGQVKAANFLRGTELRQFTEAGIPMLDELANHLNEMNGTALKSADIFEMISKRMISFEEVEAVFKRLTSEGGRFYQMQEIQAETLQGQISNLRDSLDLMLNEIGLSMEDTIKKNVDRVRVLVENWQKAADILKFVVAGFAAYKLNALFADKALMKFAISQGFATAGASKLSKGLGLTRASFVKLFTTIKAGLAASGWLLAITAILDVIIRTVQWNRNLNASIAEVNQRYYEQSVEVNKVTKAYNELIEAEKKEGVDAQKIFEDKKEQLEELLRIAKERSLDIEINLKEIKPEQIDAIVTQIREQIIYAADWGKEFGIAMAKSLGGAQGRFLGINFFGDNLKTDIEQLDNAIADIGGATKSRLDDATKELEARYDELSNVAQGAYDELQKGKKGEETEQQWLERRISLIYKAQEAEEFYGRAGLRNAKAIKDAEEAREKISRRREEVENEITKVVQRQLEAYGVEDFADLTPETQRLVQYEIDEAFSEMQISGELKRWAAAFASEKFKIQYVVETPEPDKKSLLAWQEAYNKYVSSFSDDTKTVIKSITNAETEREALAKQVRETKEIYDNIVKAYESGAKAYSKEEYEQAKKIAEEAEKAQIWLEGISQDKGKDLVAEKLKGRISLIKEMNKEYEKLNKTFTKAESLEKVQKAYADTAKELDLDISAMDFSDEGTIKSLEALLGKPEYAANKYAIELKKALDNFNVELGIEAKQGADKQLFNDIQNMFDQYDLSLELKKLNIPPDLAKSLFGIESINLEDIRKKVQGELDSAKATGGQEDRVAQLEKDLEKINDMEDKAQVERLKTYLQYTRSAIGERAKIKVEEMNKLMEIEETFNKASSKAKTEEDKKRIEEQRKLAIAGVQKESSDKTNKLDWDEFRSSDTFVSMFQDLDAASDALLNHAISKIKEFQDQWTDMPISDAKEMIDKLNELEMALLDTGKPFKDYRNANQEIENAMLARQIKPDAKSSKSQQALREDIGAENKEMEDMIANSERVVALLEIINNANAETKQQELEKLGINQSYVESLGLSADVLTNSAEENNEIIRDEKQKAKDAQKNIGLNQKVLNQLNKQKDRLNEQADAIGKAQQMANDLYEAFSELAEALGADSDSPAAIFADMGMNMLNTVLNTIQLQLQLHAATIAAQGLGVAMNAAMGVVGWIVMAIQLLAQVITAIVQANDKKIDAQVERLRAQVEELEKKYDKLSETIDEVYSTAELEEVSRKLDEIYYKEKRALEQAIAVRKADKNISDDEMDEIADMEEQLIELEEKHAENMKEIVSNATDGILDSVKDAARDFTDAWYDAFVETGEGINGLEENFNEMFMNLAKQQASMQITQAFVDRWKRDLEKYVNEKDTKLTPEDAAAWANEVKATFPELSAALEAFLGTIHESVGGLQSGELSSLQKGIQGITEETAQIIEAYLNSIRGYVSEQVTHTRNIYNILKQATTSDAAAIRVRMVE